MKPVGSYTPPAHVPGVLAPGEHLDRYELLCVLAQGGMGTVWLARMSGKLGFERLVAVKTILQTYSTDRQFSDMFLDEARIAAQIDHENVARILEIGEDRGCLYYAMELIEGESLRKLYRDVRAAKEPFPMGVALRVVAEASAGLHATHELRRQDGELLEVVHRDVSPQNLLLTSRGTTKLIDFGVAKANARRTEDTAAGTLKGKLEYMAPEQARGIALDRRADVYSLGAVLFELLAGRPVRDTDEGKQLAVLHDLMTGVPYEPLPPSVPPILRAIVDKALAREPNDRYPTADALRQALEHAIVATGAVATNEEVASALARFSRVRTQKRKDVIDFAIRAAAEGRLNATTLVAPIASVHSMAAVPAAASSASAPGGQPSSSAFLAAHEAIPAFDASVSTSGTGPSLQSVGAAMTASVGPPPGRSSAMRVFTTIVMFAAVAILGVTLGVVVTRRSERMRAAAVAAAAPPPAVVVTVVPMSDPVPASSVAPPEVPDAGVAPATSTSAAPPRDTKDGGKRRRPRGKRSEGDEYGF